MKTRFLGLLSFFLFVLFGCQQGQDKQEKDIVTSKIEINVNDTSTRFMKVLLINGSPHEKGCTYTALSEVAKALNADGIETEIIHVGNESLQGCRACKGCKENGECVHIDIVNVVIEKAKSADGFIFGSPVHYSGISGTMKLFLDRLFYAGSKELAYKPGAGVVSARRAGTTASLQQLNQYFTINNMPVVSSQYWNMVHGNKPEDVLKDKEGLQIMRTLGHNMTWLLKSIEAGKKAGISPPETEPRERTNFIEPTR